MPSQPIDPNIVARVQGDESIVLGDPQGDRELLNKFDGEAKRVDLSHLFPKDPYHQYVINGLVCQHSKQVGRTLTPDDALQLAASLRRGVPPIEAVRGALYAEAIENHLGQAVS